jgi:hypothetical protein
MRLGAAAIVRLERTLAHFGLTPGSMGGGRWSAGTRCWCARHCCWSGAGRFDNTARPQPASINRCVDKSLRRLTALPTILPTVQATVVDMRQTPTPCPTDQRYAVSADRVKPRLSRSLPRRRPDGRPGAGPVGPLWTECRSGVAGTVCEPARMCPTLWMTPWRRDLVLVSVPPHRCVSPAASPTAASGLKSQRVPRSTTRQSLCAQPVDNHVEVSCTQPPRERKGEWKTR